ncbi:hypothetical protein AALB_3399 [Agarivorans albus MKT 106]|uniref:Uncharacterized protein n=1 Tax=Agarivorans albus MKT 106 TaxID=1331007 RepID=R9PPQ9_AGAAL|nr:hypothetical protein AALB_3399 [Agarivorans albus MKT 106]
MHQNLIKQGRVTLCEKKTILWLQYKDKQRAIYRDASKAYIHQQLKLTSETS